MTPAVIFDTFTLERTYPHPPAKVFAAFKDPKKKTRWFAGGDGFVVDSYTLDFQIGGFERIRFRFGDGPPMTNDCLYFDIIENQRMTFGYGMTIGGDPLSSSHATIELIPVKAGTKLKFTEHCAFLDGNDGGKSRREGTEGLLSRLAAELEAHS